MCYLQGSQQNFIAQMCKNLAFQPFMLSIIHYLTHYVKLKHKKCIINQKTAKLKQYSVKISRFNPLHVNFTLYNVFCQIKITYI